MFSGRSRKIVREYEKSLQKNDPRNTQEEEKRRDLKSQIREEETFFTLMRRMVRENKLAVFSAVVILLFILAAIFAPFLTPYSYSEMDLMHRALLGVISGYYGRWVDAVIMRLADVMLAFPSMLLAMVILYMLGGGLINVFLTLALVNWASVARIVRAQTLALKETEYVEAARAIGVARMKIIFRHLLPNCLPTLIVLFTLNVPSAILTESSLSFLGLGVQPPAASWGLMVNQGRQYLYNAPWVSLAPCIAIMVIVLAFNFLGDGLRDVLDPHQKK